MTSRARHEHQIKLTERLGYYNGAFEKALLAVIYQRGTPDLSWFTEDQIAEIRDEMISREWDRRCRDREMQARNRAALSASLSASQKEHAL